jgi:hypothetical protein
MQAYFLENGQRVTAFRSTLSEPRFSRYLKESNGDQIKAILLYHWNSLLSQSLYTPLQFWEIALRNRMNSFLCWKYSAKWPYNDTQLLRNLKGNDKKRLIEARDRQQAARGVPQAPTDAVVAELSAGFWVSLLTGSYAIPFVWRYNLSRVFPCDKGLTQATVSAACDRLIDIRNRIAHHEPIYHLPLNEIHDDIDRMLGGLCDVTQRYNMHICTFWPIWHQGPVGLD